MVTITRRTSHDGDALRWIIDGPAGEMEVRITATWAVVIHPETDGERDCEAIQGDEVKLLWMAADQDDAVIWAELERRYQPYLPTGPNRVFDSPNRPRPATRPAPQPRPAYKAPKEYAAEIRAAIKAAQRSGDLDRKWKISVRTEQASMCSVVAVYIGGDHVTDEFLFRPEDERRAHGWCTAQARALSDQVRTYMTPAEQWADGRMHFLSLYFRDGLMAP